MYAVLDREEWETRTFGVFNTHERAEKTTTGATREDGENDLMALHGIGALTTVHRGWLYVIISKRSAGEWKRISQTDTGKKADWPTSLLPTKMKCN